MSSDGRVESSAGPTGVWLRKAHCPGGNALLSGAQQVRFSAKPETLSQVKPGVRLSSACFSRLRRRGCSARYPVSPCGFLRFSALLLFETSFGIVSAADRHPRIAARLPVVRRSGTPADLHQHHRKAHYRAVISRYSLFSEVLALFTARASLRRAIPHLFPTQAGCFAGTNPGIHCKKVQNSQVPRVPRIPHAEKLQLFPLGTALLPPYNGRAIPMTQSTISPDHLLQLRSATHALSQHVLARLRTQLDALSPLFRPRRFLGDHMEGTGREAVARADESAAELQDLYRRVAVKPFNLRPELPTPFESVTTAFHFHEWEYTHPTQTERGWQPIRVTTPLTWMLNFASPYTLASLRDVANGSAQYDTEAVRAFVFRACVMYEFFRKTPAVGELLTALRYIVEVRRSPHFGELPLVTVSAPLRTFRPPDDLVALASGMAGGHSFAEVLDVASFQNLSDPLKDEASRILNQHKIEIVS